MWGFLCLVSLPFAVSLTADPRLKQKYSFSLSLDEAENYWLYWKVDHDDGVISFAVQANTQGWVGLGISPNGKMPNSDIVTGWVNDGKAFLQDRFSTARSLPPVDSTQNVELVSASEANQVTTLEFKRNVRACESNDRSIDIGTSRMIWAYNDEDPESPGSLKFHEQNMGWRSVNLLDGRETNDLSLPDDVMHFDVIMNEVNVPSSDTTYWCKTFSIPDFESEVQMIGFDPVIESGNEGLVHHIIVYECDNVSRLPISFDGRCFANMPDEAWKCYGSSPLVGWAIGGRGERYPSDVGIPLGGKGGLRTVLMEMHYDNPKKMTGLADSSGVRIYYTTTPRKYEASTISFGYFVDPSLFLLREQQAVTFSSFCPSSCTKGGIPDEGVTVIHTLLHAHLAGRAMKLRHFRNGKELPEIDRNDNYDFNYQDSVAPAKETKILPGDILQTDCTYSTADRSVNTYGGLGTYDEMCIAYALVYPAPRLRSCSSRIPYSNFTSYINENFAKGWAQYKGSSPNQIADGLNTVDLSNADALAAFNNYVSYKEREVTCRGTREDRIIPSLTRFTIPENLEPRPTEKPVEPCSGSGLGLQNGTVIYPTSGETSLKVLSLSSLVVLCMLVLM